MRTIDVGGQAVGFGNGGVPASGPISGRGQGPCVVLLHGAGCDHTVWALPARRLAQAGYRVLAPDLPGHGQSAAPMPIDTIEGFSGRLVDFLDALGESDPVFVAGHSMGACIALAFAGSYPERVRGLALLATGAAMPVHPKLLDDTLAEPARAHAFIAAFGHRRGSHFGGHFGGAASPGLWNIGATVALLERCDPAVLNADFRACDAWDSADSAVAVTCPTVVVCGSGDHMTPPRTGRELAARISGADCRTLPDTGHMMLSESPNAVGLVLLGFLAANTSPADAA